MKTSELKSWLKDKYAFKEFNGFIIIEGNIEVGVTLGWLRILTQNFNTLRNLTLLEKVIEYAKTPLKEREEEKKYYLRLSLDKEYIDDVYLNLDFDSKKYVMYDNKQSGWRKNIFTQKEIDAMPFDTNFFIKEEVK